MDRGTFHSYPSYWALLSDYNRILRQKNTLLREFHRKERHGDVLSSGKFSGSESWDIWNTQLQTVGSHVILHRLAFLQQLQVLLKKVYTTWLGSEETIDVHYKSSIGPLPGDLLDTIDVKDTQLSQRVQELYGQAIQRNRTRERRLGTTVIGPHRDDLHVQLAERSIRSYGSQGQQRTAVLALKLAEVYLYFEQYAEYPILLLDDVTSELDMQRNTRLFECLLQGMQVFISTTDRLAFSTLHALPCTYVDLSQNTF
jgi:DNA replication and repair protein RecF